MERKQRNEHRKLSSMEGSKRKFGPLHDPYGTTHQIIYDEIRPDVDLFYHPKIPRQIYNRMHATENYCMILKTKTI